ncbi:hypothetical protein [Flavobacterium sedimenticola]|uniref:Uncharacterized protein n=1 Tax=Flavobacterium sedimenticola TaxID=3043286 RepID=A0ABT6XMK9_9FLAO|nr:hypothetical protein [Flavobacterium sedimenticola]MDI9256319.1 hypothetical protein [Flavobacterium sedimenticola]
MPILMYQRLSLEQKEKLQKLWDADYQTILKGKDNGVPYLKYLFELHFVLFGKTCDHCTSKFQGYIQKIKNLNRDNIMSKETKKSESNFLLNQGTTIPVRGTSIAYSNANLTDEIAVKLLAENSNRKILFAKLPENVDELIKAYKSSEVKDEEKAEGVVLGDKTLTVEQAISLLDKMKLKTKATTLAGVSNFVGKLSDEQKAELIALASEVKDEVPGSDTQIRTREEVEFDIEKLQQDLQDAIDNDLTDKVAEINTEIEKLNEELKKFE